MQVIPLTQGYEALVDDTDYANVNQFRWCVEISYRNDGSVRNVYATRALYTAGKKKTVRLHRYLLGLTDPAIECDHIDGNGLNNQRHNLRVATHAQNLMNTRKRRGTSSQFKGVYWDTQYDTWRVRIHVGSKKYRHLGRFKSETDAAKAYNTAATALFGEFARLNDA